MRIGFPLRVLVALVLVLGIAGLRPAAAADDPLGNRQWGLIQVHAPAAWSVSTGAGVKIGIVDSGVNRNHEDLTGKVIAAATCVNTSGNMANCTSGPNDGNDINGHGTHVAGIAAAVTGNGTGIAGVAPDAKIIEARAFTPGSNGGEPTADLNDVKAAIEWVVAQGAQIVNLSLGTDTNSSSLLCGSLTLNPLSPAIENAWNKGALPVVAAGNSGSNSCYSKLDAIIVGATAPDGSVEQYSSTVGTAKWGLVAPGGDDLLQAQNDPRCTDSSRTDCPMVLSTYAGDTCNPPSAPSCYAYLSGTSMATPHVSGAAALLFAHGLTRTEVVNKLLDSADPVSGCDGTTSCRGRLDVARALDAVPNDQGSGGGSHATTTVAPKKKSSTGGGGTSQAVATTTPTSSPFLVHSEKPDDSNTTVSRPRAAIVLNAKPRQTKGVPVGVGLAGIVSLAFAALAMSYNLRKTLTTLP